MRGSEHRQYEPHVGYEEHLAYPRPQSYAVTRAPQAPLAIPLQTHVKSILFNFQF